MWRLSGWVGLLIVLASPAMADGPLQAEPAFDAGPSKAEGNDSALRWQFLQNPQGPPAIVLLDPATQVLAVYHVDPASGRISLKSVRRVRYDLRLDEFETNKPSPIDLRDAQR